MSSLFVLVDPENSVDTRSLSIIIRNWQASRICLPREYHLPVPVCSPSLSSGDATLKPASLFRKVPRLISVMTHRIFTLVFLASAAFFSGCGGTQSNSANSPGNSAGNSNAANAAPVAVNLDPANMPPGLSASPIQQGANVPGVNANAVQPKGGTPTPGIPSPAELKKPMKPGATPTPGIPSPEEIRRMLGNPPKNANAASPPMKGSDVPMMKSNKATGGKPKP